MGQQLPSGETRLPDNVPLRFLWGKVSYLS